jgi:hypothetical protein
MKNKFWLMNIYQRPPWFFLKHVFFPTFLPGPWKAMTFSGFAHDL